MNDDNDVVTRKSEAAIRSGAISSGRELVRYRDWGKIGIIGYWLRTKGRRSAVAIETWLGQSARQRRASRPLAPSLPVADAPPPPRPPAAPPFLLSAPPGDRWSSLAELDLIRPVDEAGLAMDNRLLRALVADLVGARSFGRVGARTDVPHLILPRRVDGAIKLA
jgi:hypothetical protein